ncbi:hypothetical protein GIB67_039108 [Kingdonia uniflora]|uniref:Uncharacterized protein n=1 Tax=Kingdonia uniflora TaxID=39325 RepID=A0A7J7LKY3_9MAGN|nr:hypothetical protein GIB67_039108 [Kingdonia uniflora]
MIFAGWEGSAHDSKILRAAVNDDMYPFTVPRGVMARRVNSRAEADHLFTAFIEKERYIQGGVAFEEEESPPVVEVEEAEDVKDLGGMAVSDVYGWVFYVVLDCVGVVCCKVSNK